MSPKGERSKLVMSPVKINEEGPRENIKEIQIENKNENQSSKKSARQKRLQRKLSS